MYSANFDYVRANSLAEAITLLGAKDNARLIAGGHSLIPAMKMRLDEPGTLIDIGRIAELKGIQAHEGHVHIGALTTHAEIARSTQVPDGLREAAGMVGDPLVRNRGTIGGNVSHADPASDLPTILTALGATFSLDGPNGKRVVEAGNFFKGFFETDKRKGEVLVGVEISTIGASAYEKMANPASGYCMVGVGIVLSAANGVCTAARVAAGGLTPKATRCPSVEAALVGKQLNEALFEAASRAAAGDLGDDLIGDIHASAEYRKAMLSVYMRRALAKAAGRI
jgi:aerobic carbon-monoxide dehydrogenase medium subunit